MTELLSAFLLGIISASHCMGMCGGLMVAAGLQAQRSLAALLYNLGRIFSYMLLGLVFGTLSSWLPKGALPLLQSLSILLLALSALYLLGIGRLLQQIERIGQPLWRLVQPLSKSLLPVNRPHQALLLGMLWGFIPCGLVYTAVTFSLNGQSTTFAVAAMASFGLGTLPAMLGTALLAQQIRPWLNRPWVKRLLAAIMLAMALVLAWQWYF